MEFKEPEVTLVAATDNPLLAIYTGWRIMTDKDWPKTSLTIKEYKAANCDFPEILTEEELKKVFKEVLASPRRGVLEYVHFTFLVENVSRAFQQQLTRHRIGFSYSIQSLRMVNPGQFAGDQNYHVPKRLRADNKKDDLINFHMAMSKAQAHYIRLVNDGVKEEDARGVLPLNIFSPITFGCTYLALLNLCAQRMCPSSQGEFRQEVRRLIEVVYDWNPIFAKGFVPFCDPYQRCIVTEEKCGRWPVEENKEPFLGIDLFYEPE